MSPRLRRLRNEYEELKRLAAHRPDITLSVTATEQEVPVAYSVEYNIRCICGVTDIEHLNEPGVVNAPLYAESFVLDITIPPSYPCIDAMPSFAFRIIDEQHRPIPHPWHPNIRYFGAFAGHVCMNQPDSYTSLAWCVSRIAQYLDYSLYHALNEPPYPEDLKVAQWVREQYEKTN